jgi:hypothetical protein
MEPTPPQEAPRKASRGRVIGTLLLGGLALAIGGCALFLSTFNSGNDPLTPLGAVGFFAGVLAFVVGAVWGLARLIARRFDKANQTK